MSTSTVSRNPYVEEFEAHGAMLPGAGLAWLQKRKSEAIKRVRVTGIPHRRMEEWKYSDLRGTLDNGRSQTSARYYTDFRDGFAFSGVPGPAAQFLDGRLRPASLAGIAKWDGVEAYDLGTIDERAPEWVVTALGTASENGVPGAASLALMRGGLALRVRRGVRIPVPFHLDYRDAYNAGPDEHSRLLIVVEEDSALTLTEAHGENWNFNLGVEICLGPNARLDHVWLDGFAEGSAHTEGVTVVAARGARYRGRYLALGAKLSRLELNLILDGEGAEADLAGVSLLADGAHADITTRIAHAAPGTTSRQLFKMVAGGRSRAVYQGKIIVKEGAVGSDSRQTAKALLLGSRSEADLKPELEILADDVKCAHGAAVGELDAESLFYLRSRGVPVDEARTLLIEAFLAEAVDGIESDDLRNTFLGVVGRGLADITRSAA